MEDLFLSLWQLLYEHGASAKKEEGTRRYWTTLPPEQQRQVFNIISTKLSKNQFVQYDPIRAIKENLRLCSHQPQTLSYADYYTRYGTTEECDGWKRQYLPDQQKTIYVKM